MSGTSSPPQPPNNNGTGGSGDGNDRHRQQRNKRHARRNHDKRLYHQHVPNSSLTGDHDAHQQRDGRLDPLLTKNNRLHHPRRGGPGILWTCETGRERKCRHQAMEVLNYYYNLASSSPPLDCGGCLSSSGGRTTAAATNNNSNKKLSLEEELAQLRRSPDPGLPFSVYETKCRGTVLMLCTERHRFVVPPNQPSATSGPSSSSAVAVAADGDRSAELEEKGAAVVPGREAAPPSKRPRLEAVESVETVGGAVDELDEADPSEIPSHGPAQDTPNVAAASASNSVPATPWDPLMTVRAAIRDVREESWKKEGGGLALTSSMAVQGHTPGAAGSKGGGGVIPSTRFVTRMIPLQATCYASLPDLKATFSALLQWYVTSTIGGAASPSAPLAATAYPAMAATAATTTTTTTTTYMVQSKRRHCDNLTSQSVIDGVAQLVPSHWKVDLRDPQVVVWVEICTNVAGISIVPGAELREMFHFNLQQARTASVSAE